VTTVTFARAASRVRIGTANALVPKKNAFSG
jgi:hypothetical protein